MGEIQNYDYQKISDKEDYNNEQIKKILQFGKWER